MPALRSKLGEEELSKLALNSGLTFHNLRLSGSEWVALYSRLTGSQASGHSLPPFKMHQHLLKILL